MRSIQSDIEARITYEDVRETLSSLLTCVGSDPKVVKDNPRHSHLDPHVLIAGMERDGVRLGTVIQLDVIRYVMGVYQVTPVWQDDTMLLFCTENHGTHCSLFVPALHFSDDPKLLRMIWNEG